MEFCHILLRLKNQLGVPKDQDVAAFLGLTHTAFAERKKRGSFPEREVVALAQSRPDLRLDLDYIFTGHTKAEFDKVLSTTTPAHMKEGSEGKEASLLRNYHAVPAPLQDVISELAETIATLYVAGKDDSR